MSENPRWTPWLLAVALLAAPLLTGCIGFGGEDAGGNETGENQTQDDENATAEDDPAWSSENRTGTVSPTSQFTMEGQTESITVEDGASQLLLNLSADGGELTMCIMKPGGNGSGNSTASTADQQQGECDETKTTQDGNASYQASSPESGDWTVRLTAAQGTTGEVEYTLTIAQKVPLEEQATDDGGGGASNATIEQATTAP